MGRVLSFVRIAPPSYAPPDARIVLMRLVDDLQLIAAERPVALAKLAELAGYWAQPVRVARREREVTARHHERA